MNKYVVIAFAFMGVWFYEASGGSDFVPGSNSLVVFAEPKPVAPRPEPRVDRVARADTGGSLTSVTPARVVPAPQPVGSTAGLSFARGTAVPETAPTEVAVAVEVPVTEAEPRPVQAETAPVVDAEPDYRFVEGDRVNLRGGPGTDHAVVGRLLRNDMVQVLQDNGDGWLQLLVPATGEEGWIADWLVTAAN